MYLYLITLIHTLVSLLYGFFITILQAKFILNFNLCWFLLYTIIFNFFYSLEYYHTLILCVLDLLSLFVVTCDKVFKVFTYIRNVIMMDVWKSIAFPGGSQGAGTELSSQDMNWCSSLVLTLPEVTYHTTVPVPRLLHFVKWLFSACDLTYKEVSGGTFRQYLA